MNLLDFSESLKVCFSTFFLSLAGTLIGSLWTDYLYPKAQNRGSLSFPGQIVKRARYRKPALFLTLLLCFYKAWHQLSCPELCYMLIAISLLLFFTVTDFEQHVILNEMLLPFAAIGLCYTLHLRLSVTEHIFAALGGGLFFILLAIIGKGAIGGGDIKLIAALGLWLGIKPLASVILYGAMAGGVAALFLLLTQKVQRKQYLAYGPYFALSGIGIILKWLHVMF